MYVHEDDAPLLFCAVDVSSLVKRAAQLNALVEQRSSAGHSLLNGDSDCGVAENEWGISLTRP